MKVCKDCKETTQNSKTGLIFYICKECKWYRKNGLVEIVEDEE